MTRVELIFALDVLAFALIIGARDSYYVMLCGVATATGAITIGLSTLAAHIG